MKLFPSLLFISIWVVFDSLACCQRPAVVNIGAIFTFDSVIGRAARPAMEAAAFDINNNPRILNGTELRLMMEDANCSVFLGSIEAFKLIEKETVAIIGPQSSGIAHMISQVADSLQVPLVSFAATDPTLSALQFPFFIRTTQSDFYQMKAIADLVEFYGWREVIAIFVDDDYGRNGIDVLENHLEKKMGKLSYKLALPIQFGESEATDLLKKSKSLGPRVYVVHVNPDPTLRIFAVAGKLEMMNDNYVWLATDWLSTTLDSVVPMKGSILSVIEGVVGLRQHTPWSIQKREFLSRWRKMKQNGSVSTELNTYGLQAYDTVWLVANAIHSFINEFNNFTFSSTEKLLDMQTTGLQMGKLKVFNNGTNLLNKILQTDFIGLTGRIQINQERNIVNGGYDVININNISVHTVGYWSNSSGFSIEAPERHMGKKDSYSHLVQRLGSITWPGGKTERPRGWVIADNERPLRIGVPNRVSFLEFISQVHNSHGIQGYCIDVFVEAKKLVPYDVPYRFVLVGDGHSNPSYDGIAKMVAEDVLDGAVGDIAIVTNRTKMVDFSQPFFSTGLVILAPINDLKQSAWVFLKPFTVEMWCATAVSFLFIGVVIWLLEHRVNDDFRGPPKRQLITVCMFSFSTLFKRNQERTITPLGRMVMVIWLFLLMVITASYTASLTSILTIQQLSSPITGINSLITNNWPIGYQVGSFAYDYLSEDLHIPRSRLRALGSPEEYETALRQGPSNGGVAAIVDELPYVQLFLRDQPDFGIIGQQFTSGGWGFAFQRESPLAVDISSAILKLSENGELQTLHEKWFCKMGCLGSNGDKNDPSELHIISFWGLYLLCGVISLIAFLVFLLRMIRQYARYKRQQMQTSLSSRIKSHTRCSQIVFNFLDFIDEKEEAIKRMYNQHENPQPQASLAS
ncbi:hypothetical protein K2173_003591 [Erythroxylum novogranatense]|uniref:Glutamate receptor n=1 Tax=Erythroxylum novogranatense TaxID=1862640 RepID=A0AAV8TBY1_9ROSI|nr:hypothetical protein K2173_003591 [Erythroxylum novogranatense]